MSWYLSLLIVFERRLEIPKKVVPRIKPGNKQPSNNIIKYPLTKKLFKIGGQHGRADGAVDLGRIQHLVFDPQPVFHGLDHAHVLATPPVIIMGA
jgi:hypothetical protein